MWARVPETEGVSCGLGNAVSDRMCRDPSLRGLPVADVARYLGVSVAEAQAGIVRLAEAATGQRVGAGLRGCSLDEVLGARGGAAPKTAIDYAPDAQGGFATPAAPGLLEPGTTDPRVRSFTRAILDPNLVAQYGEAAVRQLGVSGLVPPPEDLDRVALFAPPPIDGSFSAFDWLMGPVNDGPLPDGSYRDPTWADVQTAGTAIGRPDLDALAVKSTLAWWRQAYALGPLPEDEQAIDTPGSSSYDWPRKGIDPNLIRRIYFWGFGKDGRLYKHMQVQKCTGWDASTFKIFNQWGQDLTFVWNGSQWIAGFDFGDWFTQNKRGIVKGLQLGVTAVMMCVPFASAAIGAVAGVLFGVSQFGFSIGVSTAIASAVAAQQMFVAGMTAIAKGDLGAAFQYFSGMVTDLGNVPTSGSAPMLPPEFKAFTENPAIKSLAAIVKEAGSGDVTALVAKARQLGGTVVKLTKDELAQARDLVPEQLRPWFDQAAKEGGAALARRASVPWYAIGVHDFGTTLGTIANPYSAGIHAPKAIPTVDDSSFTLAQLEAELADAQANYDRVAQTAYGQSHPSFLAQYQQNIDALKVRIAVKKNPAIAAQPSGGASVASFSAWAAAHPLTAKTQAPSAPASPVPVAVTGGLLALLFFL